MLSFLSPYKKIKTDKFCRPQKARGIRRSHHSLCLSRKNFFFLVSVFGGILVTVHDCGWQFSLWKKKKKPIYGASYLGWPSGAPMGLLNGTIGRLTTTFSSSALSLSFLAELEGSPAIGVGKHEQEDYNSLSPSGIGKDAEVTDDVWMKPIKAVGENISMFLTYRLFEFKLRKTRRVRAVHGTVSSMNVQSLRLRGLDLREFKSILIPQLLTVGVPPSASVHIKTIAESLTVSYSVVPYIFQISLQG